MRLSFGSTETPGLSARRDLREKRFNAYFPRLFAFACEVAGGDEAARDITVGAFADAFSLPEMGEAGFEMALFKAAREQVQTHPRHQNDGLTAREREVVALVFDAQLDQEKIAELMGIGSGNVSMTLATGLRKLQSRLDPAPAALRCLASASTSRH